MAAKDKSSFSHFFKEDERLIKDVIKGPENIPAEDDAGVLNKKVLPKLITPVAAPKEELTARWQKVRSFYRHAIYREDLNSELAPLVLSSIYTQNVVGTDFPVWLSDDISIDGEYCLPLSILIGRALEVIAPEPEEALLVKTNINRILHIANEYLSSSEIRTFRDVLNEVLEELKNQYAVAGDDAEEFHKDLDELKANLPEKGILLPHSINIPYHILYTAMNVALSEPRKKLIYEIDHLISDLEGLLRVEKDKHPKETITKKDNEDSGLSESIVDFDEINAMAPEGGSESLGQARINRISSIIKNLKEGRPLFDKKGYVLIDEEIYKNGNWIDLFDNYEVEAYENGNGCNTLSSKFSESITAWETLFRAKRIGHLEVDDRFREEVHTEYYDHFHWDNLSNEELDACPHFVLLADEPRLFESEFSSMSAIYSNNLPVNIIAIKKRIIGASKDEVGIHTQTKLGGLMLSQKNIFVGQSTSITPNFLFNCLTDGLSAFAPAFLVLLNIENKDHDPYLLTSAAIESRDFPAFSYKGILGTAWGSRFDVKDNPQAGRTWPVHKLQVEHDTGEIEEMEFPFTFADLAVLNKDYQNHFLVIDPAHWSDNLIHLTVYISNSDEENIEKIPFIWMIDNNNNLHKVAVSWPMALAAQERLDFWRRLQENSGINNYHVIKAVEYTKEKMQKKHKKALKKLMKEHESEIEMARDEEAEKVMENLTSALLNLDLTSLPTGTKPLSKSTPAIETPSTESDEKVDEKATEPKEAEITLSNDPYIDTPLCTSCNECTNLNGKMFMYNNDKMAYIADASAGTFAELVQAAEKCPVKIIHPGSPLNPDEPNLDDLITRAAKFN
ncbi:MAG: ferredoxin [Bacteroidota bacterium]